MSTTLFDGLGRPLSDLRISVTDRCNFRCKYCMPREVYGPDYAFLRDSELLSFPEIVTIARAFANLGVRKLRLTGGEPLLRKGVDHLVSDLANIPGIDDIAMTTNGSLLTKSKAMALHQAGLRRLTISLDATSSAVFKQINDVGVPVERILRGIDHASEAGFSRVKINVVIQRGVNDDEVVRMAEMFRGTPHVVRFIEYMDVGHSNGWKMTDVVPANEMAAQISEQWPLTPLPPRYAGEVAKRYQYADGQGEIGFITSVTHPFCGSCTRARLSSDGQIYTCLFANRGVDLRSMVRGNATAEELESKIRSIWQGRTDRYSEIRTEATTLDNKRIEMSRIGG